ncbi:MAG: 50S ribosomal protein L22 [Candidatus Omnitrophica bacterium]|nr:50S ribosomal protein L22 [Candidatus Omnitrophota bacterium]
MISKATLRFIRFAPRKLRQVIALVKGEPVNKAIAILENTNKQATKPIRELLNSALSNAKRIPSINIEELYISKLKADEGPMLKRYKAQAMGRATMIRKKTSHITMELDLLKGKR